MDSTLVHSLAVAAIGAFPSSVEWAYFVFGAVFAIGLIVRVRRGEWSRTRGFDKLILLGPLFYVAPVAAFGTEHFTATKDIASLVPAWIPWHYFWAYFVGACFIAAGLSVATEIQARLAASLLALTFFLFVVLMDAPGWVHHPANRFALALMFRELSFSGGALALAVTLSGKGCGLAERVAATVARYFIAVPVAYYSLEQFLHARYVPGIPLELLTPQYAFGHAVWNYLAAAVYAVVGILLLAGWKTRAAAAWLGITVFFLVLVVYVPFGIVERASIEGFNYLADTLMYCGAVLLLAGAMPREGKSAAAS